MSFNSNDNNQRINLGNYEEYFILYMDNELSDEQKALVDAFLLAHPDLQAEFELLLSTQLTPENLSLDKEALWSHSMKLNAADEALTDIRHSGYKSAAIAPCRLSPEKALCLRGYWIP